MQADEDPGFRAARPEGIELGSAEREAAADAGDRRGPDADGACATLQLGLQLLDRGLDVGQADEGHRKQATLPIETPFLIEPEIEGREKRDDRLGLMAQPRLDHRRERGKDERGVDALLVHHLQAALARSPFDRRADRLAGQLAHGEAFAIFRTIPDFVRAGRRDDLESRVRDIVGDLPVDHELGASLGLHEIKILGEGLG